MVDIDIELIKTSQYSNEVLWAVRYGYQYRLEADKYSDTGLQVHNCLSEASSILLWLGKLVIEGTTFNIIAKQSKALWNKMMSMKMIIPKDVDYLLLDENELRKFVTYVGEFNDKELSTTVKQAQYIKEEIIADYVGETAGEIWSKAKRQPTKEEWIKIYRDANQFADELIES